MSLEVLEERGSRGELMGEPLIDSSSRGGNKRKDASEHSHSLAPEHFL